MFIVVAKRLFQSTNNLSTVTGMFSIESGFVVYTFLCRRFVQEPKFHIPRLAGTGHISGATSSNDQ